MDYVGMLLEYGPTVDSIRQNQRHLLPADVDREARDFAGISQDLAAIMSELEKKSKVGRKVQISFAGAYRLGGLVARTKWYIRRYEYVLDQ